MSIRRRLLMLLMGSITLAWLLAALSVSTPASNTPLPLQSFQAVVAYV